MQKLPQEMKKAEKFQLRNKKSSPHFWSFYSVPSPNRVMKETRIEVTNEQEEFAGKVIGRLKAKLVANVSSSS